MNKKKCNCHLHEKQVCDICQKITGKEKDKKSDNHRCYDDLWDKLLKLLNL